MSGKDRKEVRRNQTKQQCDGEIKSNNTDLMTSNREIIFKN